MLGFIERIVQAFAGHGDSGSNDDTNRCPLCHSQFHSYRAMLSHLSNCGVKKDDDNNNTKKEEKK